MDDLRGLHSVRISKNRLLEQLNINKAEHKRIYDEAIDGWEDAVREAVEQAIKDMDEQSEYRTDIFKHLPKPEDHSDDYERIIEQLEWSLDDEFELSSVEFQQYVKDNWSWKQAFTTSTANYR